VIGAIDRALLGKGWKSMTAGLAESVPLDEAFDIILKYCGALDELL